jgi:F420-dependent oxidoreductase-like protein
MASGFVTSAVVSQLPLRERLGLFIEANDTSEALSRVSEAEDAGLSQLWFTAPSAGGADTLTFLGSAAAQTRKVRLGTAIVPIYTRHPAVMAQQVLGINDIAPGRFRLGVGVSHRHLIEDMYGVKIVRPHKYLKEYVAILRDALWQGKAVRKGDFFNVDFTLRRKAEVPILVSALGPKAYHVAGEISDGAISWICPVPYLLEKAIPALRAGASSANRPLPPLVANILVALTDDKMAARAAARRRVQRYISSPFYSNMFSQAGFAVTGAGEEGVLDAITDSITISGTEAAVKTRLGELLSRGLDELLVTFLATANDDRERKALMQLMASI